MWDSGPPADDPGAPTVLLLHGWTATAATNWCRCFRPLASRYRVVAPDHRGHGKGIRSLRPFTLEDCADDAAVALRVLRTGPALAVGYSMGGPVAQLLWRRHRDLVAGMVLCATAARFGESPLAPRAAQAIGVGLSVAFALVPVQVREQARQRLGPGTSTRAGRVASWARPEGDPVALVQAGAAIASYDALPWIGEVDVPTAVVVTTDDRLVAPSRQLALAHSIPGAEVLEVAADHHGCVESEAVFVPALLDALARVRPGD